MNNSFIIIWVLFLVLFTDRLYLTINSSNLEILPIINVLFTILIIVYTRGKVLGFIKSKIFILGLLPFLYLNTLYPLLGVIIYNYPLTSTYLSFYPLILFSFIVLGFSISKIKRRKIENYLIIYIMIQSLYSLIQFLYWKQIIFLDIMIPLINWDLKVQVSDKIIYGRSIGLFTNPNVLGFWSVITFWVAFFLLKGIRRNISIILVLFVLVLSQSRGSIFTLIITLILYYFTMFIKEKKLSYIKGASFVLTGLILAYFLITNLEIFQPFLIRMSSAFDIFNNEFSSDENLNARIDVWKYIFDILPLYPFGTLGSPELIVKTFIDNEWVRLLIQGSLIFIISFLVLIWGIYNLSIKQGDLGKLLLMLLLSILFIGLTQIPLSYSPIYIFWFLIGILLRKRDSIFT